MTDLSVNLSPSRSPLSAEEAAPFALSSEAYLLTKVTVPPLQDGIVVRSALIALLERRVPLPEHQCHSHPTF